MEAVVSTLLPLLLHGLHEYGYPVLWLAVFIAAVGFPLPTPLILLAAGAFAVQGDFNIVLLLGITLTAASCGDNVGYFIGRRWGGRPLNWLVQPRRLHFIPVGMITRSRLYFKRRGAWAIFFSRFLLPALGGVTNLLAGAEHYPYRSFLLCDITGDALGVAIPLSLGYGLGACWKAGGNLLSIFSWVIFMLFLVVLVARKLLHAKEASKTDPAMNMQQLIVNDTFPENPQHCVTENRGKKFLAPEAAIEECKGIYLVQLGGNTSQRNHAR